MGVSALLLSTGLVALLIAGYRGALRGRTSPPSGYTSTATTSANSATASHANPTLSR